MPSFQPATIEQVTYARRAVDRLKEARGFLVAAGGDRAVDKVRHAIKSAEGALRHVEARYQRTIADPATDSALFPLAVNIDRASMTERREIASGLYAARDGAGALRLFDRLNFRGYVTKWPTLAKPDGYHAHTWPAADVRNGVTVKRAYANQAAAEIGLIRDAIKLHEAR